MTEPAFASAADGRGFAWFARWVKLGGQFDVTAEGFALAPPVCEPDEQAQAEILVMVQEVHSSPLLAHAIARSYLDYCRWAAATNGGRTHPDGAPRP